MVKISLYKTKNPFRVLSSERVTILENLFFNHSTFSKVCLSTLSNLVGLQKKQTNKEYL